MSARLFTHLQWHWTIATVLQSQWVADAILWTDDQMLGYFCHIARRVIVSVVRNGMTEIDCG